MSELLTIGHSNLTVETFLRMLNRHSVETLVDVRSMPGSRACPQFDQDTMRSWLQESNITYMHMPLLGGRRRGQMTDVNVGWENRSFRRYADYTMTDDFEQGLTELLAVADRSRVAFMCSEAQPWKCHRLLISNILAARDHTVHHISATGRPRRHELGLFGATPHVTCDEPPTVIYPHHQLTHA